LVKRMNLFASSLFELDFKTAIGNSISIVWRGITYWMSVPAAREVSASLSGEQDVALAGQERVGRVPPEVSARRHAGRAS
jgi:hypothetical protein